MSGQEVSLKEFAVKMYRHRLDLYTLELDGYTVPVLHGLIALAARHPGIAKMGDPTRATIDQIRNWTLEVMRGWGFTNDQLKWLDGEDLTTGKPSDDGPGGL
jgi:hypothetical protein